MALFLLILFIASFFFPPLWLVFIGTIIYLLATGKKRRAKVIGQYIKYLIDNDSDETINVKGIYWDSASKFARECGAEIDKYELEDTTYTFDYPYKGSNHTIMIHKFSDSEFAISRVTGNLARHRFNL